MSVTRAQSFSWAIGNGGLELRDRPLASAATAAEVRQVFLDAGEEAGPAVAGLWGDLTGTDIVVAIDGGNISIRAVLLY